jgi:hypothetical protein
MVTEVYGSRWAFARSYKLTWVMISMRRSERKIPCHQDLVKVSQTQEAEEGEIFAEDGCRQVYSPEGLPGKE